MITPLKGLPAGVIGFEASGRLEAEDYRVVLFPALKTAARAGDIRLVIVMASLEGITAGALWQDLEIGVDNLQAWKRIALVTDIEWMQHLTNLFGWMTSGEVRTFPLTAREEAIEWAAAS